MRLTIITIAALLSGLALAFAQPDHLIKHERHPELAFLAGHWRAEVRDSVVEEHWFPTSHGSTTGTLRWFTGEGEIFMFELLTIRPGTKNQPEFLMRHFDPDMQPWESEAEGPLTGTVTTLTKNRLVIETETNARDTETITYEAVENDGLRFTITFDEQSGRSPLVIEFTRVS